jgi:hypothetical protein
MYTVPDERAQVVDHDSGDGSNAADAAATVLPWRQTVRKAAQKPLQAMGLMDDLGKMRMGRVVGGAAGVGSILSLLAAANELNDPTESAGKNLAQAGGVATGSIGGGTLGAILGGIPFGPVGALAGGAIGGALGGEAGKGLLSFVADVLEGSPEDKALRSARKQAELGMALEAQRMKTLLPIQDTAAKVALQNEVARAKALSALQNDAQLRQNMAQAFLMQQQAGAQQQLATTQAVLGGLG